MYQARKRERLLSGFAEQKDEAYGFGPNAKASATILNEANIKT